MAENADTTLLQRLIDRAVQTRLQPLQNQLFSYHWLLAEVVRQLPRAAQLDAARRLEQMARPEPALLPEAWRPWQTYLCQLGGLIDGDMPPPLQAL